MTFADLIGFTTVNPRKIAEYLMEQDRDYHDELESVDAQIDALEQQILKLKSDKLDIRHKYIEKYSEKASAIHEAVIDHVIDKLNNEFKSKKEEPSCQKSHT